MKCLHCDSGRTETRCLNCGKPYCDTCDIVAERDALKAENAELKEALGKIGNAVELSHNSDLGGMTCISVGNKVIATQALKGKAINK